MHSKSSIQASKHTRTCNTVPRVLVQPGLPQLEVCTDLDILAIHTHQFEGIQVVGGSPEAVAQGNHLGEVAGTLHQRGEVAGTLHQRVEADHSHRAVDHRNQDTTW